MSRRGLGGRRSRSAKPERTTSDARVAADVDPELRRSRADHPSHAELHLLVEDASWKGSTAETDSTAARPIPDLRPFRSGWGANGSPLAVARVGPTRLTARRIHRSYVIEIARGEDEVRISRVFCAPEPGVTPEVERAAAALVESLALPANSVIRFIGPVVAPPPRRATRARLLGRRVDSSWVVASGRWGGRFPSEAELDEMIDEGPAGSPVATDPESGLDADVSEILTGPLAAGVYRLLSAVLPVPAPVSITRQHVVSERWEGDAKGELVTEIGIDGPWWTETDEPHDIAVDRHGHVIEGETGWICPVCSAVGCWKCPTDELLAACTACGQEACGVCRTTAHGRVAEPGPCSFCSIRSCDDCGHRAGIVACAVCDASCCDSCRDDGLCPRCSGLEEADDVAIGRLPVALHAHGLAVALGNHRDTVVVALRGTERREVAILRRGEIVEWWSAAAAPPAGGWLPDPYRATGDGNTVLEWEPVDAASPGKATRPHLIVEVDERPALTWSCEDESGAVVVRSDAPVPVDNLRDERDMHAALGAVEATGESRWPTPASGRLSTSLDRLIPDREPPVRHRVRVSRHSERRRVEILGGGMRSFDISTGEAIAHVAPWREPLPTDRSLFPGWSPEPIVFCAAVLDDVSTALACFGSLVVLAVAQRNEPLQFHPLTETTGVLESIELGQRLTGALAPTVVTSIVAPSAIDETEVIGATLRERFVRPLVLAPEGPPSRAATSAAVRHWTGAVPPVMPTTSDVPADDVADALFATARSFGRIPEPRVVSLGVEVVETWDLPSGPVTLARRFRPAPYVSAGVPELGVAAVLADPINLTPPR